MTDREKCPHCGMIQNHFEWCPLYRKVDAMSQPNHSESPNSCPHCGAERVSPTAWLCGSWPGFRSAWCEQETERRLKAENATLRRVNAILFEACEPITVRYKVAIANPSIGDIGILITMKEWAAIEAAIAAAKEVDRGR